MNPNQLLEEVAGLLWQLARESVADLAAEAENFPAEENAPAPLQGRLLIAFNQLPQVNPLAEFVHGVVGDLPDGRDLRLHGWRRTPQAPVGVALVASKGNARAVLALTPEVPPKLDVVVTPGEKISISESGEGWKAMGEVSSNAVWDTEITPDAAPKPPVGEVTLEIERAEKLEIGPMPAGPGISAEKIAARLVVGPATPLSFTITVTNFQAALIPGPLAGFLGAGDDRASTPVETLALTADAKDGLRFDKGGLRFDLPAKLSLPGVSSHGFALQLAVAPGGLQLRPVIGLAADLPGLPVHAGIDDLGVDLPFGLGKGSFGQLPEVKMPLPGGIELELNLPPVKGGGAVLKTEEGYAGVLDLDLGIFGVQAIGLVGLPTDQQPTSILALLSATFPYPGIQLGFGFALDAVGGLVGINRRADVEQLRTLVSDGHADRILFPENAVQRAQEIARSLEAVFPTKRGRFVVGPMVRLNWGGRIVTLSGAVILDLPGPAQVIILGRLAVSIPDPEAPLIFLQASVLGRIDPSVPETEVLVSLAGSRIVTTPVSGEIYLLARGGERAVFVLSAGGFHPRYTRPPGVPELQRLTMDLGGGFLGLRAEAYLAVTSNALMFGANLHLDATIAGCGVEGQLGLDALFVYEPTFSFSVRVYASVAVLAFGHRLAGIGLDFTLEGPNRWHAFGTGSISILWWDVSLDFDVSWGDPAPPLEPPHNVKPLLEEALRRPEAWMAERPPEQRAGVQLTRRAKADLAAGAAVNADATYRVTQSIVPLGKPISRLSRQKVPAQSWDMVAPPTEGPAPLNEVKASFIPAEFFDLPGDRALTGSAFEELKSGLLLSDKEVDWGAVHLVDDSYETGYKPEKPDEADKLFVNLVFENYKRERFAGIVAAEERAARWREVQAAMPATKVAML
ncbi:MAG TPA: DUF6603 domain-containing protein [Solirubrobacterales bacterium]|nr:DUF6603 domain-containing protein [Solirubrobacterales bacterium]